MAKWAICVDDKVVNIIVAEEDFLGTGAIEKIYGKAKVLPAVDPNGNKANVGGLVIPGTEYFIP